MSSYHWDWGFLWDQADDGRLYAEWLWNAWLTTILIAVTSFVLALAVGTLVGTCRMSQNLVVRTLASAFTEIFRNVPLLVQLFLWYLVLPDLVPTHVGVWMKLDMPAAIIGIVGLGLYTSARIAEQVRAGLGSISSGQRAASKALGLSTSQSFRYVLLPNAFRRVFPTLTTEAMNAFKNTSVTFAVGVAELTFQYRQIIEKTSQVIEVTLINLTLYMGSALLVFWGATLLDGRLAVAGGKRGNGGEHVI
jgi:glutamate/aspartate transport system permease protein